MPFEKFWKDKQEYDSNKLANTVRVTPNPAMSSVLNRSVLFKNVEDRDTMSDSELRYFIQNNLRGILNNAFNYTVSKKYLEAFQDERFLSAFADVLAQLQFFDQDVIVRTNLIIYHYITHPYKKQNIVNKMMRIASIINFGQLRVMKKFNLTDEFTTCLLVSRYSDFNMEVCVKRVNMIMLINPQLFMALNIDINDAASEESIDTLSQILVELFEISEWGKVLPYFMLDVLPEPDGTPATQWITPEIETMDSTISLALLHILDTMIPDSNTLAMILKSYAEGYKILKNKKPVRFSFRSISYDYPRLKSVIEFLENSNDPIYIP